MHSPGSEVDLVRGLLFTEGIYQHLDVHPELNVLECNVDGYPLKMDVQIPEESVLKAFSGTRNMASVSSCGICGKTELDDVSSISCLQEDGVLDASFVEGMFEKMRNQQSAFDQSGGTHAAAAFNLKGEMLVVKEDIGRHNAVDKVIGNLINEGKLDQTKFLAVSGRISYEIVSKALVAGIPFLGSVSAPSTLAVETANKAGITLLAFCRNDKLTVYTHPERMMQLEK
ncbi:MAG: formate dehydrogenase accessory sulfurtransferase FdhD [Bacteroidetes bacterium]|nr:formate dehydrogenase accessory sulfurtransferase FdhD [Bacteroidota bacterium]